MTARNELDVIVADHTIQADDIVSIDLVAADSGDLPEFAAGSHVDVYLDNDLTRQYSICNDPRERHRYRLGILKEQLSRGGSAFLHAEINQHARLRISAPRNNFAVAESARRSILIAGGIGITPILSMAYHMTAIGHPFVLHYCCRTLSRAAFFKEMAKSEFQNQIALHLDDGDLEQKFDFDTDVGLPDPGCHLYACGPSGFLDFVVDNAKMRGWANNNIHIERFSAPPVDVADDVTFTVIAARSGITIDIPPGQSIATALAEAGVDLALSCEQGICRTCLTNVFEGEIIHRDDCLSTEERQSGKVIAVCCSRARGRLVLDL